MDSTRGAPDSSPLPERSHHGAAEVLFPLLYDELRRIAHRQLGVERAGHTLCTTALVHEAYVKLADQTRARSTVLLHGHGADERHLEHGAQNGSLAAGGYWPMLGYADPTAWTNHDVSG